MSTSPNDPEAFLILAEHAMQQGRTIEAEALYDKALQLTEKFTENPKRKRNFEIRAGAGARRWPNAARIGTPPWPICRHC